MKSEPERQSEERYAFGPYQLDVATQRLTRDGELVPLPTRKAFQTLLALVKHGDRLFPKEDLVRLVWPDAAVSDESLTQCVSIIRRALSDDSGHPKYIATVPRHGYRFIAPVTSVGESSSKSELEAPMPDLLPLELVAADGKSATPYRKLLWIAVPGLLAFLVWRQAALPGAQPTSPAIRLTQTAPAGTSLMSGGVLSPDGRRLAFLARDQRSGITQIWVRALESSEAHPLPGTERARQPFWSPDGDSIAFFGEGRRIDGVGRNERLVRPSEISTPVETVAAGGSWGTNGTLLFAGAMSPIYAVSAAGGSARPVTTVDRSAGEAAHRWPQFLPDERRFLYLAVNDDPEQSITYVGSLDSRERVQLLKGLGSPVFFAAPDSILYVRDNVLMAQTFDTASLTLRGSPVPIASDVTAPTLTNRAVISAANGVLTAGSGFSRNHLTWYSRSGQRLDTLDTPNPLQNPSLSPDQHYLSAEADTGRSGIWLFDLERGASWHVVPNGAGPIWSPGSDRIAFAVSTASGREVRMQSIRGTDPKERVIPLTGRGRLVVDWSSDGRYLLYSVGTANGAVDLWILPLTGNGEASPFLQTPYNELYARLSPDARYVAYASDESGRWDVYVQSFPKAGVKRVVSVGGGSEPQWRRDGRELFYLGPDGTIFSVRVTTGDDLTISTPTPLFVAPFSEDIWSYRTHYTVTQDGQRFLINTMDEPAGPPINVVINWTALINPLNQESINSARR